MVTNLTGYQPTKTTRLRIGNYLHARAPTAETKRTEGCNAMRLRLRQVVSPHDSREDPSSVALVQGIRGLPPCSQVRPTGGPAQLGAAHRGGARGRRLLRALRAHAAAVGLLPLLCLPGDQAAAAGTRAREWPARLRHRNVRRLRRAQLRKTASFQMSNPHVEHKLRGL